tara:strand:+ start:229 stop:534 length:306 start_codon:yes stop_codon:yes gene_type:complete
MLLKDIDRKINEKEIRKYGINCYDENCYIEDFFIEYLNENGSGVYSIECGSRGEIDIEKVVCEKLLNSKLEDVVFSEEEYEESIDNGDEIWIDYFYFEKGV